MRSRQARLGSLAAAALPLLSVLGCQPQAASPKPPAPKDLIAETYQQAALSEQLHGDKGLEDVHQYLRLLELSAEDVRNTDGVLAALRKLLGEHAALWPSLGEASALVFRAPGAQALVERSIAELYQKPTTTGLTRMLLAASAHGLALFRGDVAQTTLWRQRMGNLTELSALGPLSTSAIRGVQTPNAFEAPGAPFPANAPGISPFITTLTPRTIRAENGIFSLGNSLAPLGTMALVGDVQASSPQRIWIALDTSAPSTLIVGGKTVLPFDLGRGSTLRIASVDLPAGATRLVLRIGKTQGGRGCSLRVVDSQGSPLSVKPALVGAVAPGAAENPAQLQLPTGIPLRTDVDVEALAATGDRKQARRLLEPHLGKDATPLELLAYGALVLGADDVPYVRQQERYRSAVEEAAKALPLSWGAALGRTAALSMRKNSGEASIEGIHILQEAIAANADAAPLLQLAVIESAKRAQLDDVASSTWRQLKPYFAETSVVPHLEALVAPTGAEADLRRACEDPLRDQGTFGCFQMLLQRRMDARAQAELGRLRTLLDSPQEILISELQQAFAEGDAPRVLSLYEQMPTEDRQLTLLGLVAKVDPSAVREKLKRDALTASDGLVAIHELVALLDGIDLHALDEETQRALALDKASPASSSAATLVLLHKEHYSVSSQGLVHGILHDVRRVMGTTDVDSGGSSGGLEAVFYARADTHLLRRVVYKKDGRVLEPDEPSMAQQGNSDLSQLEPGDIIEEATELWASPDQLGQIVFNTPELLPPRVGIRSASIELEYPRTLSPQLHAHPLLGTPQVQDSGDTHTVRYTLTNVEPRPIEEGLPHMDQLVGVTFGTLTWQRVATQFADLVTSLKDEDPYFTRWLSEHLGVSPAASKETVARIVEAVGTTVKHSSPGILTDQSGYLGSTPRSGVRAILELGEGSRTRVILQALLELKIPAEVVLSEQAPFSSDPTFPAQPGRFTHPLLLVHLPASEGGDEWIDADVSGPPLPPGQFSPELRGRTALRTTGALLTLPTAVPSSAADEIALSLTLDRSGRASGTLSITQRGQVAQLLTEAFERVVGSSRQELLRSVVLSWVPWASVDKVALVSKEDAWTVQISAEITINPLWQRDGELESLPGLEPLHSALYAPHVATLATRYTTEVKRQSDLAIDSTYQYHFHRHIQLPPGATVGRMPQPLRMQDPLLSAQRTSTFAGGAIDDDFSLSLPTGTVAADRYVEFAAHARQVDDAFLASTGVRLP